MTSSLLSRFRQEKERLTTIFLAVFALGLIVHGYGLLNFTINHDSMNEFWICQEMGYYSGTAAQWKIALGRFVAPLYQFLFRGQTVAPWFGGMLALFWTALAVWGVACLFDIRQRWLLIFTCGIFTVNLSFVALAASFLHDLDSYLFAALAAVAGSLCWRRGGWRQLLAIPLLVIVLGIYQSMISVYISLVIFASMLALADKADAKTVFLDGLRAIGLMAAAGVLYLVFFKIACALSGVAPTQQENGLAVMLDDSVGIPSLLLTTITSWLELFVTQAPRINALFNALMFLAALPLLWSQFKPLSKGNKVLFVILLLLLPFGMNISAFLSNGRVHLLMFYAAWLMYLLLLLLCRRSGKPGVTLFCCLMIGLVLFSSARFANQLYVRKDQERQATLSLMTRVCDRIEQIPGYVPGQSEVAILGTPDFQMRPEYADTYEIEGSIFTSPITTEDFYASYFSVVLQSPIRLCDAQRREALAQQAADLPAFPAQDCVAWIDGTLVLKLSSTQQR